jgi:hypothetical protein
MWRFSCRFSSDLLAGFQHRAAAFGRNTWVRFRGGLVLGMGRSELEVYITLQHAQVDQTVANARSRDGHQATSER